MEQPRCQHWLHRYPLLPHRADGRELQALPGVGYQLGRHVPGVQRRHRDRRCHRLGGAGRLVQRHRRRKLEEHTNWLSDRPLSEWYGVATDANGQVTKLSLNGNQLSGEIPANLGNLANLWELCLGGNQLSGEIPSELGDLPNLEYLSLDGNRLTGEIPSELGNLANLEYLYLRGNQLSGCVPVGLRDVPNNDLDQLGLPDCS